MSAAHSVVAPAISSAWKSAAPPATQRSVAPESSVDRAVVHAKRLGRADLVTGAHAGTTTARALALSDIQPPELLRRAMAALQLTPTSAAERLGYDRKTVRRWIRGECRVDGEVVCWAMRVLLHGGLGG